MRDSELYAQAQSKLTRATVNINTARHLGAYDNRRTAEQHLDKAIEQIEESKVFLRRMGEES